MGCPRPYRSVANLHLVVRNRPSAMAIFDRYGISGTTIEADLRDSELVRDIITKIKPQITFNLVGYGVAHTECDETTAYQINAQLVFTVCQVLCALNAQAWSGRSLIHAGFCIGIWLDWRKSRGRIAYSPIALYGKSKGSWARNFFSKYVDHMACGELLPAFFQSMVPAKTSDRLTPSLIPCC